VAVFDSIELRGIRCSMCCSGWTGICPCAGKSGDEAAYAAEFFSSPEPTP
jgi:hypothetical protein